MVLISDRHENEERQKQDRSTDERKRRSLYGLLMQSAAGSAIIRVLDK